MKAATNNAMRDMLIEIIFAVHTSSSREDRM
jgi:hypothetical protein